MVLYVKWIKVFYIIVFIIYVIVNIFLIVNVIYYREFFDFIIVSVVLVSSKILVGFGDFVFNLLRIWDFVYVFDFIIFIFLFVIKKIYLDDCLFNKCVSFFIIVLFGLFFLINLFLVEIDCLELLSCGFLNIYIVKVFGLLLFLIYSGN